MQGVSGLFSRKSKLLLGLMTFGYSFLYAPIIILIWFSFNDSRTISVWSGFSLRWYGALLHNEKIWKAAWVSLKVALCSATLAIFIGTLGALVMVRYRAFKGKTFFNSLVTAPLVMPDVMTGLALLLMFVMLYQLIGWPHERGMMTISIGHTTISIAYVLVIVRSRLLEFDRRLEEAALDLGARPYKAFFLITLPIILPSVSAGWLLAFTLSLDDVVLASMLSGPGATTLPMLIFSSIRFGVTPEINALGTLIIVMVALGVVSAGVIMAKREKISE